MTETKLVKFRGHVQNIKSQAEGAQTKLGNSDKEREIYKILAEAVKLLSEAVRLSNELKPSIPPPIPKRRTEIWEQRRYDEAHPVVVPDPKPVLKPQPMCKYLVKTLDKHGTVIERRCKVHMDMEHCGENCPYNTNVAYKARSKPYLEKGI